MENSIVKVDMTKIVDKRYFERIKKIITNKYNKGEKIVLSKIFLSRESIIDYSKFSLNEIFESLNTNLESFNRNKYYELPSKRDINFGSSSSAFNKQFLLGLNIKSLRYEFKKRFPTLDVEEMTKKEIIDFILADVPEELL